jgi:hypothetical protein
MHRTAIAAGGGHYVVKKKLATGLSSPLVLRFWLANGTRAARQL